MRRLRHGSHATHVDLQFLPRGETTWHVQVSAPPKASEIKVTVTRSFYLESSVAPDSVQWPEDLAGRRVATTTSERRVTSFDDRLQQQERASCDRVGDADRRGVVQSP
jgi:hypothetical protein